MAYFIGPATASLDTSIRCSEANGATCGIKAVHELMCTELDRIERVMQEVRQSPSTEASDDQLLDAYLHIYTNLISGLASIEEALHWLQRAR